MKRMKLLVVVALALAICLPGMAVATPFDFGFANDTTTNAIYLWMNPGSPQVNFNGMDFRDGATGWHTFVNQPDSLFFTGSTLTYGGLIDRFHLFFSNNTPFSFQWAEVLWDNAFQHSNLNASGTLAYSNGGWSYPATFTHGIDIASPVPLPPSVLLLGSGLLGLVGLGWRRRQTS